MEKKTKKEIDSTKAFEKTVKAADALAIKLKKAANPEELAAKQFAAALTTLETHNIRADAFVPATSKAKKLAMSQEPADRKSLFQIYLDLLRKKLCTKGSELDKLVQAGIQGLSATLVTLIITTLGLSVVAFPIAIPLAGFLMATGVEAFCEWKKPADSV